MNYKLDDLVAVAKRDQNKLRPYLYVNPIQGKHVPVRPKEALALYSKLAELVTENDPKEKMLVIGFAETATAIGVGLSIHCEPVIYCTQTTRETCEGAQSLYFTESHSHAKEQSLFINGFEEALLHVDRIVFAEDEVTTGNTILKLIQAMRTQFPNKTLKFTIACILNSMQDERIQELSQDGIDCVYISRLPYEYKIDSIDQYECFGSTNYECDDTIQDLQLTRIGEYSDLRLLQQKDSYVQTCHQFVDHVMKQVCFKTTCRSVLVLGSEEFMMPPLLVAEAIKKKYPRLEVNFHATTRSPILVSADEQYPLHKRYELDSMYEEGRLTYVYNLKQYDYVFVITDAQQNVDKGALALLGALRSNGCEHVEFIQWGCL